MSFGVSDILFGGWGDAWNDAMGLYHELGSEAIEMVQQNIIGPAVEATRAAFTPDVPADVAIELEEIVATAPQEAVTATLSHVSEMMHDMPEFDGRVGTFDMTSAEDLNEVLQTLRNVQWTKEMDSLNMDAPAYVRQGDTWLSRQTISIEDAWGSTDALDGTGMSPFDVAVYDNLAEEVPDMVELMEMKTVPITGDFGTAASTTAGKITEFVTQGGSGDWPGEDVGGETAEEIEASGRVSEPISVDYENINTEELNSLVEDQMERVGFEIDNAALAFEEGAALAEGVTWAMIGVQVGYMVVGGGVLIGINFFQQWIYEKFNIPTGITFLGQWLIEQSDEMTREYWAHHPTGMQETAQFAFGYWQLEPGYRVPAQIVVSEQGMKSVTIRYWDADTVPNPRYYHLDRGGTITGKSSDELVTNYGHNDKENEHWLAIDRHQTFEGGRFEYLQNAPVKQLPDVDDYLAVFSVGDDSYRITRTSILAQAFLLFSFEDRYKNDPYLLTNLPHIYVWFRDNGLVGQKPPPRNMYDMAVNYLDKPLSRTNMWIKARVMLFDIRDSQRWLVLSIDEGVHNFWFRWGVDGPLLRDSAKIRASCILANHKILRTVLDPYSGGKTGETAADAWARRFRTSGYNPSTIPPEFSGGESINPMDPPNFDQTAQVPAPPEPEPSDPDPSPAPPPAVDPVGDDFVQLPEMPFFGQEDIGDTWAIPTGSPSGESMDVPPETTDGWEPFNTIAQMRAGEHLVRFEDTNNLFWDRINNGWVSQSALANPPEPFNVDYTEDTGTLMPDGITPKWLLGMHRDSALSYMPSNTVKYFLEVGANEYFDIKQIPFQAPMLFSTDQRDFAQMMYTHSEYLTDTSGIVFKIMSKRKESNKNYFLLQTSSSTVKTWTTDPLMTVYHPSSKYEISVWKTEWAAYQVQAAKDARIAAKGQRHLTHVTQAAERVKLAKANQGEKRRMYNKGRKQAEVAFMKQYRSQFDTQSAPETSVSEQRALQDVATLTRQLKESRAQSTDLLAAADASAVLEAEMVGQIHTYQTAKVDIPPPPRATGMKQVQSLLPDFDYILYPIYGDDQKYLLVTKVASYGPEDPNHPNNTVFEVAGIGGHSSMSSITEVKYTNDPSAVQRHNAGPSASELEALHQLHAAQQTLAELRAQLATQTAQPTGSTASQQLLDAEAEVEELRRRLVVQKTAVALVPSRMIGSKEADPRLSQRDYRPSAKRRKRSPPVEAEVLAVLPPGPVAPGGTDATLVVLLVITAAVILASS